MMYLHPVTAQRWGVTIPLAGISLADHQRVYRESEDLGYTDFWGAESDVDGVVPIALGAAWTKRATLGIAILGVFNRGPENCGLKLNTGEYRNVSIRSCRARAPGVATVAPAEYWAPAIVR